MGNHFVGRAIGLGAEAELKRRLPEETALEILDRLCELYRGSDAEFGAEDPGQPGRIHPVYSDYRHPHPDSALGMLMLEAFAPHGMDDLPRYRAMLVNDRDGVEDKEQASEAWWCEVRDAFANRYDFY